MVQIHINAPEKPRGSNLGYYMLAIFGGAILSFIIIGFGLGSIWSINFIKDNWVWFLMGIGALILIKKFLGKKKVDNEYNIGQVRELAYQQEPQAQNYQ